MEGTNYNKDGSTEVLIYDQEGYICTRYLYSSDGVLTYNGTYEYMLDENGELIGYKEEVENRGTLIIRYAFKKNGEKYIKYREEIVLGEGTVMESYDDDGRIIRKSEYAADNAPYRFTTYTYNSDGSYIVERRNLSNEPAQGVIQLYVDELLLGLTVERTKLIFSSNTRVNSCFLRGNTLYLDLSDDLLSIEKSSFPINEGIELLRENILKNFSNINKIELFIGGKFVASMEK